ncbi:MAG: UDPGP type 1 family protein [Tepidisphaeraceae bacterium]|jgi:UDP-N-acetylglucosamine/UDP-N-acetylgalactosamine diphosphorylase
MDTSALRSKLAAIGQEHVLRYVDRLDASGQEKLLAQVAALDLAAIADLADEYVRNKPKIKLPSDIRPAKYLPAMPDASRRNLYADAEVRGEQLLKEGKVAAFLVAGGQGTRLGYDGPKGQYPVTPIKNKPLFQVFAEQLLSHSRRAGRAVPWYIMTSDVNDAPTRAFFQSNHYFGLQSADVVFFQQGMMPAFDFTGRLLLAEPDSLALSPDGHGGSLRALHKSGALEDMRRRGVEHLSYFQVDNPLVHCVDPLFLGLHDLTGSEMSSKTVSKAHALEKVGNFVNGDGAVQVIEYSDLPEALALATDSDGKPRFNAASIGIHALRVAFVERLNASGRLSLPWHRAEKKVPCVDENGAAIKPDKPNAVKLEQFVFDAIPVAKNAMIYQTQRGEEFSPVKNADGADSPATCRRDQIRRAARWLKAAGATIPMKNDEPDAVLEISPLLATSADELRRRITLPPPITAGGSTYLDE